MEAKWPRTENNISSTGYNNLSNRRNFTRIIQQHRNDMCGELFHKIGTWLRFNADYSRFLISFQFQKKQNKTFKQKYANFQTHFNSIMMCMSPTRLQVTLSSLNVNGALDSNCTFALLALIYHLTFQIIQRHIDISHIPFTDIHTIHLIKY